MDGCLERIAKIWVIYLYFAENMIMMITVTCSKVEFHFKSLMKIKDRKLTY